MKVVTNVALVTRFRRKKKSVLANHSADIHIQQPKKQTEAFTITAQNLAMVPLLAQNVRIFEPQVHLF